MRKLIFLFSLIITHVVSVGQTTTLDVLRKDYYKAAPDSAACAKLYIKISNENSADNTTICYKGAIMAVMANHVKSKSEKLKLFNAGKKFIEQSIAADKENLELRFLRFTVQSNCPKILGYNNQLDTDKTFMLDHLDAFKNSMLKKKIGSYLLESDYLTPSEKKRITIDNN